MGRKHTQIIDNRQPEPPEIEHFQRQIAPQTAKEMTSFAAPNERSAEKVVKDAETYLAFLQNTGTTEGSTGETPVEKHFAGFEPRNEDLKSKLYEALGAASVAWSEGTRGIFLTEFVTEVGEALWGEIVKAMPWAEKGERLAYVGKERGNIVRVTHYADDEITFVSDTPAPKPQTLADTDFFAKFDRAPEFDR